MSSVISQQQRQRLVMDAAVLSQAEDEMDEALETREHLTVVRVRRFVDHSGHRPDTAGPWTVLVDGQYADLLGLGRRIEFYVRPGWHHIEVRVGKHQPPLRFCAEAGAIVDLVCHLKLGTAFRRRVVVVQLPPRGQVVGAPNPPL